MHLLAAPAARKPPATVHAKVAAFVLQQEPDSLQPCLRNSIARRVWLVSARSLLRTSRASCSLRQPSGTGGSHAAALELQGPFF